MHSAKASCYSHFKKLDSFHLGYDVQKLVNISSPEIYEVSSSETLITEDNRLAHGGDILAVTERAKKKC